jgi:hypothetical protein
MKCSFKDSFVDSDHFLNIDEKPEHDGLVSNATFIDTGRDFRQKSLKDMIKERCLGPIVPPA